VVPNHTCLSLMWYLGSGESGKSTIVKQMKIIHQNGYSVEELAMYRLTIYKNLVDCAKALVMALRQFDIEPDTTTNRVRSVTWDFLRLILTFGVSRNMRTL